MALITSGRKTPEKPITLGINAAETPNSAEVIGTDRRADSESKGSGFFDFPITITRTYDTLQSHHQGDFGYGWRMDLTNVRVQVIQPDHDLPDPRPFIDGDRIVFNSPDASTHGFTFYGRPVNPNVPFADPQAYPAFQADWGSNSRLQMTGRHPALLKLANGYDDVAAQRLYNPGLGLYGDYELTLRSGVRLAIDPRTGELRQLTDRTGHRVTFGSDDTRHSAGRHVRFVREQAGRITEIILPDATPDDPDDNPRIRYQYDGRGDLVAVTDRAGATTAGKGVRTFFPHLARVLLHRVGC